MPPRAFRALFPEFQVPSWAGWNSIEDAVLGEVPGGMPRSFNASLGALWQLCSGSLSSLSWGGPGSDNADSVTPRTR